MDEKRYQVFISSTFEDLRDERRAVQDVIISTGDFPVQMESMPAADEDQFEFIKSLIDHCDYYVLIIAGRYGTIHKDGLSYTHKEFIYARTQNVPVLVMINDDIGKIETGKSEASDAGKAKLKAFIEEAETGRLRKTWSTLDGLKLAVREALDNAKATKPRVGWVRGNTVANVATFEELNQLRKENETLRNASATPEIDLSLPPIPNPSDTVEIQIHSTTHVAEGKHYRGSQAVVTSTWITAFPTFHSNFRWDSSGWNNSEYYPDEVNSCLEIGSAIAESIAHSPAYSCFTISKDTLKRLTNYYIEAGLMRPPGSDEPFTSSAEKIARRYNITNTHPTAFTVKEGMITVSVVSRDLDDDIPF